MSPLEEGRSSSSRAGLFLAGRRSSSSSSGGLLFCFFGASLSRAEAKSSSWAGFFFAGKPAQCSQIRLIDDAVEIDRPGSDDGGFGRLVLLPFGSLCHLREALLNLYQPGFELLRLVFVAFLLQFRDANDQLPPLALETRVGRFVFAVVALFLGQ